VTAIQTVLGPVAPDELGRCLPHEHLVCDFSPVTGKLDHILNDVNLVVDELALLTSAGGTALVDVTPPDLGRDPVALQTIARRSGVHVVMSTGWYRRAFYPPRIDRSSVNELASEMIRDLTTGVGDTGIRAGLIAEIGVDAGVVSAVEERVLRASGRAQRATGAAISTHSSMYPVGVAQLEVLLEEGADPHRVVVGHADTFLDLEYHEELLRQGVFVQFDTVGREHMNPDARRAASFMGLVRRGWTSQLLLSSDRCFRSDLVAFAGAGYAHVLTSFRDRLLGLGLSQEEFDVVTIRNPATVLTW